MAATATPIRKGMEAWRNATQGPVYIRRYGHLGDEKLEMVGPGRVAHLTVEERRDNQKNCASEALDMFRNGTMVPIHLLDDSEEARELASSPNLLADSEMVSLVKGHAKTFTARLSSITNPSTLRRLLEVAREQDATIRKVEAIEARLEALEPSGRQRPPQSENWPYGRPISL